MGLRQELVSEVDAIFDTEFKERDGRKVPEPEDVKLGNDAVKLDGTVLYADLADSTGLVKKYYWWFAAEVYKAYLICSCKIIRRNNGGITAFDGDRVMAVYIGDWAETDAARTGLQINYAVNEIINPKIKTRFTSDFELKHAVGIDRSSLHAVRTGIRGSNDLVWVGMAANIAAKLCGFRDGCATNMTEDVYKNCDKSVIYGGLRQQHMWTSKYWRDQGKTVYQSSWQWEP